MKETAKRRRSKAQIKQEKEEEQKRQLEVQAKLAAWPDVERQLENANSKLSWAKDVEGAFH